MRCAALLALDIQIVSILLKRELGKSIDVHLTGLVEHVTYENITAFQARLIVFAVRKHGIPLTALVWLVRLALAPYSMHRPYRRFNVEMS